MSVFSNPRVIEALRNFVPVAQNTGYTQYRQQDDAHARYFWKVVDQSSWREQDGHTTQGLYTFDAGGRLFGYMNERNVDKLLRLLEQTQQDCQRSPLELLDLESSQAETQPAPPPGVLVADVFARISPLPDAAPELNRAVGRDHLWITSEEVERLLQSEFPNTLRDRLTRFHLWDNVRGEPDQWLPEDVQQADFVAAAEPEGRRTRVRLSGSFSISSTAELRGYRARELAPAGYKGSLHGELLWDPGREQVLDLKVVVTGTAWGEGTFTPGAPPGEFPLNIGIVLAPDDHRREIAPQGISWVGVEGYLSP